MVLVGSAFGHDVDLRAGGAAVFWSIGFALDFELFDTVNGRINKNGALRADIIVRRAVHRPLVPHGGRTAERNIHGAEQTLALVVEALANGRARNKRGQLHEAPAIHGEFANLFAEHNVTNVASRIIYDDGGGF